MADQFNKPSVRQDSFAGRVYTNQKDGRIEIYDADGICRQWVGDCGMNTDGTALIGTLTFGADGVRQTFVGIYSTHTDGSPIAGTVTFDAEGDMIVLVGVYGASVAGTLVFDSSGIPIFHSGYQVGGY